MPKIRPPAGPSGEIRKNKDGSVRALRFTAAQRDGNKLRRDFLIEEFGSVEKARGAGRKWVAQQRRVRTPTSYVITERDTHELLEARAIVGPFGVRVTDALREWTSSRSLEEPWTFAQACDAFIDSRRSYIKHEYLRTLEDFFSMAKRAFGSRTIGSIKTEELEEWIRGRASTSRTGKISAYTWRNNRRDLSMVFRLAIMRNHCLKNPAAAIPNPKFGDEAVTFYTTEETQQLLVAWPVRTKARVALQLFCGLRPYESCRFCKNQIDWSENFIEIMGRQAKTRDRRLVSLSTNAVLWLKKYDTHMSTAVSYWSFRDDRLEACHKTSLVWHPDILRHTFATHHLAANKDPGLTAHELGHNNQQTLRRHYRGVVTEKEGKAFFEIKP